MVRLFVTSGSRRGADERGASIVTALMIALTIFALGATWTGIGIHQVESSSFERSREQALHSAEAGINLAMSVLAGDPDWEGSDGVLSLADGTGQFEVTVSPLDPTNPLDLERFIVARGYAPSEDAIRRAARQLEQQVLLVPSQGFEFALFAAPGGISGQNNSTITGDVYSTGDVVLGNNANVFGTIVTPSRVSTTNQSTVSGDIHAGSDVSLENSSTTIQGSVFSGGSVSVGAEVQGHVQAAGSVGVGTHGSVAGTIAEFSPPPQPTTRSQPAFQWDATNYPSTKTWSSASGFMSHWSANQDAFAGHHRVQGGDSASNKITWDKKTTLTGDVTLVAEGPVALTRDISNGTNGDVTLTVISFSTRDPAIALSNNLTFPDSIKVLLFAPHGAIDFSQLKHFHGVVYGKEIRLSQQFTLSHFPVEVPGFTWDASAATNFSVQVKTFREVSFDG